MRRRCGPGIVVVIVALGSAAVLPSGCSSTPTKGDWKSQKKYGALMAKKGFWREALFRFEKAAAAHPEDAEIQNDLAVGYESVGETARALAAYKKAIELDPNSPKIKRNYARFAEYYTSVQRASSAMTAAPGVPVTGTALSATPGPTPTAMPVSPPERPVGSPGITPPAPAMPTPLATPAVPAVPLPPK